MLLLLIASTALAASPTSPGTTQAPPTTGAITICPEGEFRCRAREGLCIPESWTCDGIADCADGEDERRCEKGQLLPSREEFFGSSSKAPPKGCAEEEFKCNNYNATFAQCVPRKRLCDGHQDCEDRSDEGGFCGSCPKFGCSHGCNDNPVLGPTCTCPEHQELVNVKTCEDIDECKASHPCNHQCINRAPLFVCKCEPGFSLHSDGNRCVLDESNGGRLFVSYNHGLKSLSLDGVAQGIHKPSAPLRSTPAHNGNTPGMDNHKGKLYLASNPSGDPGKGSINVLCHLPEADDDIATEDELVIGIPGIANVAVDWVSELIYYVAADYGHDDHSASMGLCSLDGRFCAGLNLTDSVPLHRPRGLVLHPRRGLVFWSDWGHYGPRIEAAAMDGSWRQSELIVSKLEWPNALAMDFASERLYWGDAQIRLIEFMDLHSLKRELVIQADVHHPYDLAVFDNTVYWTDWAIAGIQAARLNPDGSTSGHPWLLSPGHDEELHYALSLHHPVYHSDALYNPCATANCSHLCALAPDSSLPSTPGGVPMGGVVAKCLCPMGYSVDPLFPLTDCVLDTDADWSKMPQLSESLFQRRCAEGTACDNGGICLPQWKREGKAQQCHCSWAFSGRYCEIDESRRWAAQGVSGRTDGGIAWIVALIIVAILLLLIASITLYYTWTPRWKPIRKPSARMPRIPSVSFFRNGVPGSILSRTDEERQHIVRLEDGHSQSSLDTEKMDCFENPGYSASAPVSPSASTADLLRLPMSHASMPSRLQEVMKNRISADDSGFDTAMDSGEHDKISN